MARAGSGRTTHRCRVRIAVFDTHPFDREAFEQDRERRIDDSDGIRTGHGEVRELRRRGDERGSECGGGQTLRPDRPVEEEDGDGEHQQARKTGQGDGGPVEEKVQTEFDVIMTSAGQKKISVIKVIKDIIGLGLKESKEFVDALPKSGSGKVMWRTLQEAESRA